MRIVLDPGHGGHADNGKSTAYGARGQSGVAEKDATLELARRVQALVPGATLTRGDGAQNPTLAARAQAARAQGADVFVSLHASDGAQGTWIHPRAGSTSTALGAAVQTELARLGGAGARANPAVRRGDLAVLAPEYVGPRTAACLVEVACLGASAGSLESASQAIARGLSRHAARFGRVRALDDNYFTDTDQLDAAMKRSGDTRVVSDKPAAHQVVTAFRGSTATSPWRTLDRGQVADRLDALIDDARLFQQGSMNLCGPASFFTCWCKRDPVAFANFATQLFDTGASSIGGRFDVRPSSSLLGQDYAAMRARMGTITEMADWMVLGALRNNGDSVFVWTGQPGDGLGDQLAGMTVPSEIVTWLQATGLYQNIDNQMGSTVGALSSKGFAPASQLEIWPGTDIIVLIQGNMVADQIGIGRVGFLAAFPNHFVVLNERIYEELPPGFNPMQPPPDLAPPGQRPIHFNIWSFGRDNDCHVRNMQVFGDNYFGAIVAKMPSA